MRRFHCLLTTLLLFISAAAQDYFYGSYEPFDPSITSPEEFLGREIGQQHTRHDLIVSYLELLAEESPRATLTVYGYTHERRKLVILTVSDPQNINNLNTLKEQHLAFVDTDVKATNYNEVPVFVQLAYNVHGNEPSSSEAAVLTAYTLVASQNQEIQNYLKKAVVFIDPTINPDGRDRHTQWVNSFQGDPLVADNIDAEHTEMWPRGRTNHYWFDLNRDWLLAINPESRAKLKWYHEWYPNVVTDFHEMGTNSTYFFEPMKPIGSLDPIMPKENYEELNDTFAPYFEKALNEIGSFYFTKEAFDGTYPGYGSSYPDLQGALALLFEQASSRGHLQNTDYGTISFPFTIRNQYVNSLATLQAAVENKARLREYQQQFFKSAVASAKANKNARNGAVAYEFGDPNDLNRTKAFLDKLLIHKIKTYKQENGKYVVPLAQPQKRMVQTVFETYDQYRDSVYYDASAWSVANFYNMPYQGLYRVPGLGEEVTSLDTTVNPPAVQQSSYAYLIDWNDYNASAALAYLQRNGLTLASAFKPFTIATNRGTQDFDYGTLLLPVSKQKLSPDKIYELLQEAQERFAVPIVGVNTGFSSKGIDLGSRNLQALEAPKPLMLIGNGINSYEAGEVWHLLDTRVEMPITKVLMDNFNRIDWTDYNTLVMVSGNYSDLDDKQVETIKNWVSQGNTLIASAGAARWAIQAGLAREELTTKEEDSTQTSRKPYVDASANRGKMEVGGAIFEVDLDLTHPMAFGYTQNRIPVYKNNEVFIKPSKSAYNTVAKYTENPHIDGFIAEENLEELLKPSASVVVSGLGRGRIVLLADNPNFRGSWYGTNRLFLNALFLGQLIDTP
ncbi:M14 family zinc carboxypeptidase [Croceiramulus getboli]|nr:M14 family zinc carboxypeptidase [Flavobacteriaceae bacterium YJPT1-3]